jgi:hypothetical protein
MHGFWHCQTVTPIENSKQNPARTLPHAMHAASKPENNKQSFALVSDTKKAKKTQQRRVSFSGFA